MREEEAESETIEYGDEPETYTGPAWAWGEIWSFLSMDLPRGYNTPEQNETLDKAVKSIEINFTGDDD